MNPIVLFFHKTGSPPWFYRFSGYLIPWLWAAFLIITAIALYLAFFHAPVDYQQGATVRIMYLHVPAAWMSMMIYGLMAIMGFGFLFLIPGGLLAAGITIWHKRRKR